MNIAELATAMVGNFESGLVDDHMDQEGREAITKSIIDLLTVYFDYKSRIGTRIVASAILLDGIAYTGLRHHQIIGYLAEAGFPTPIRGEQGFIDDTGRFLSRKDAAALALASGQVTKLLAPGMGLDSADIFARGGPA